MHFCGMQTRQLLLYNYLDEYEARRVAQELATWGDAPQHLDVRIHSPGGEVFSGFAIYEQLLTQRRKGWRVHTHIDGLAASMASIIAMAGEVVLMAENARLLVHNPWTVAEGDGETLRRNADELDRIQTQLLSIYAQRSGQNSATLAALMAEERYLSAKEALAMGLVQRVVAPLFALATTDTAGTPQHQHAVFAQLTKPSDNAPVQHELRSLIDQLHSAAEEIVQLRAQLSQTSALPALHQLLTRQISPRAAWTIRDWEKQDPQGLACMQQQEPQRYAALFEANYGKPQN